jgi:hypothetical protein
MDLISNLNLQLGVEDPFFSIKHFLGEQKKKKKISSIVPEGLTLSKKSENF